MICESIVRNYHILHPLDDKEIMTTYFITVNADIHKLPSRLDSFMQQYSNLDYSRSYFATRIKSGDITVNDVVVRKPSYEVLDGSIIAVVIPLPPSYNITAQPVEYEVVAVEKDFIVVNKPAGLVVHHSHTKPADPTLIHGLVHQFKELSEFTDQERPGIVHRLDKDTSGLLIVARTQQSQAKLSELFKKRAITKVYSAIVCGHTDREGEVELPIGRHPVHRHKMKIDGLNARESHTKYTVSEYLPKHTLVTIRLITGRTHQIRVHFAAIKHPLLGDAMYGLKSHLLQRQALHAKHIEFEYEGKVYSYSAEMPQDMKSALDNLRKIDA